MPVISNETRLIGGAMRHGRRLNRISRMDAARALRVSLEELGLIEGGRMVIPLRVLNSLLYHGLRNKCSKDLRAWGDKEQNQTQSEVSIQKS